MKKLISINPANEIVIKKYNQYNLDKVQKIITESSSAQLNWREKNINDRINVISDISHDISKNINSYAKLKSAGPI